VLPADGGLKGVAPEEPPDCSHGFGGGLLAAISNHVIISQKKILQSKAKEN
jgi:hypothetical protein